MEVSWTWAGWIVASLLGAFAIKAKVKFDLNEHLKERRRQKEERLRSLCPHVYIFKERGKVGVRSAFTSPIGVTYSQCEMCGKVTHDPATVEQILTEWAENPTALRDRSEKMKKLAKKLGRG